MERELAPPPADVRSAERRDEVAGFPLQLGAVELDGLELLPQAAVGLLAAGFQRAELLLVTGQRVLQRRDLALDPLPCERDELRDGAGGK